LVAKIERFNLRSGYQLLLEGNLAIARSVSRTVLALVAALAAFAMSAPQIAARDLSTMSSAEIHVLQQRLADAACYKGPIDGQANAALETAKKACPDQEPVLRIETGMHIATIKRISADTQCHILATGSEDKTLRLWSMPDGHLLRTLRPPIGPGNGGKIFSAAMSPDGSLVAAGGWDAAADINKSHSIYLFGTASGTSVRRIGNLDNVVFDMAFSPDGSKLAAALGARAGIRVLDVASGRELMADRDYQDNPYGITFGPDGSLYAVSYDGFVRRYNQDLQRTAKVATVGGKRPYSIAADPTGRRVAIGYDDTTSVDIYDAQDLHRIGPADTRGVDNNNLFAVGWSRDAKLYAGGMYYAHRGDDYPRPLRPFSSDGSRAGPDINVSENTVLSIAPCGDGVAFGAYDPAFGLVRANGTATTLGRARIADMRTKVGDAFVVSADGTRVRFGLDPGAKTPVLFDLTAASFGPSAVMSRDLAVPLVDGLGITDWKINTAPRLRGKPILLERYERSLSLAGVPDGSGFVVGADWNLRRFEPNGAQRWHVPSPSATWGVNVTRDGGLVVAAYADGTIRWYRASDGHELLAFFVERPVDGRASARWVAWTPSGYYMASPGGEDLIGWHINRGWQQPADFFPASRFRERFNRPDIVQLVLEIRDEGEAVQRANATSRRHEDAKPLESTLPPIIKINSPSRDATFSAPKIDLTYSLRSPTGLPVDRVDILIDGSPTGAQARGVDPKGSTTEEIMQKVSIGVPQRDVDIGLVARSGSLISEVAHIKLAYRGAPAAEDKQQGDALKPNLYALLVGVANYKNPSLRLEYSGKDAEELATALKAQAGALYRDVKVKVLIDAEATSVNVKDGLLWLQKETTSRDLAIVFFAGHGLTDSKNEFWYLPYEADTSRLLTTAVSRTDVMSVLGDLPGKKILFIDACHAGAVLASNTRTRGASVDLNSAINDFATAESGLVVYGAATGRELSVESDEWHHGAFTKALIEAIGEGKADITHKGKITTALLDAYLAERVKQLTGGEQHPVMSRPEAVPDFPLALVK
jgi:WD40 repeat protein